MNTHLTTKTGVYGVVGLVLVGSVVILATSGSLLGGLLGNSHAIDSCTTIDEPGRYELTENISASGEGVCINITASNVTLDGHGHTIDGSDYLGNLGVFVLSPNGNDNEILSNVTVTNLTVTDWETGISYISTINSHITDTNSSSNERRISVHNSTGTTLSNNIASSNDLVGISVAYSERSTLSNNTISSNDGTGIAKESSTNITLSNNTIIENDNGLSGSRRYGRSRYSRRPWITTMTQSA